MGGKKFADSILFGRVLLSSVAILIVDTIGWIIDGRPICGQIWFIVLVDGLDLILTTTVCWCWVQYAIFIAYGDQRKNRRWHRWIPDCLLVLQVVLVMSSRFVTFYFSVDSMGVYHRERGYYIHCLISMALYGVYGAYCVHSYRK